MRLPKLGFCCVAGLLSTADKRRLRAQERDEDLERFWFDLNTDLDDTSSAQPQRKKTMFPKKKSNAQPKGLPQGDHDDSFPSVSFGPGIAQCSPGGWDDHRPYDDRSHHRTYEEPSRRRVEEPLQRKRLPSHYETLGVSPEATSAELRSAYTSLAKRHHPDNQGGDRERFEAILRAWTRVNDDLRRKKKQHFQNTTQRPSTTTTREE